MKHSIVAATLIVAALAFPLRADAHCDTTKGPVITAAQTALDAGDAKLVLHWVRPQDEAAISQAFQATLAERSKGPEAKARADRAFFETLVRIHREGEGAPFTGIKEGDPEPIIAAADRALEQGSTAELEQMLTEAVKHGLAKQFNEAKETRAQFKPGDVPAGQKFVAAYVPYTHWVEGLFNAAQGPAAHHAAPGHATHGAAPETHATADHGAAASGHDAHGGAAGTHGGHLQWLLIGALGLTAVIEGAVLVRRRRRDER